MERKTILLLAANPLKTVSLRLQEEEREIKECLRLAGYGRLPISSAVAVRPRDMHRAMLDFKPQIVHFSGHGTGQRGIVLESITGEEKLVKSEVLAELFKLFASHVECVILNACYSDIQADAIGQHIDYVIGMSQAIGDKAAIEFAVGFYTAVGAGESYESAYKHGCVAIAFSGLSGATTPLLKKKLQPPIIPDIEANSFRVATLKNEAYWAEIHRDFNLAEQLWVEILKSSSGQNDDAIKALQRIAINRLQAKPIIQASNDYAYDLVICIDNKPSMRKYLERVRFLLLDDFLGKLLTESSRKCKKISRIRVKVIIYGNRSIDFKDTSIVCSDFFDLASSYGSFVDFVKNINASKEENEKQFDSKSLGLEALALAINSSWDQDTLIHTFRKRYIVWIISDSGAYELGEISGVRQSSKEIPSSIDDLTDQWSNLSNSAKRLLLFAPDDYPWTILASSWENSIHFSANAGEGLLEFEMDEILGAIVGDI